MAVRRKPFGTHTLDKSEEPTQGRLEVRGDMAGTGPGGPLVNPPAPPPFSPDAPGPDNTPREGTGESPRELAGPSATPRRPMEPTPMAGVPGAAAFTPMPAMGGVEDLLSIGGSPAGGASLVPGAVRRRSALAGSSGGLLGGGLGLPGGEQNGGQDISPLIAALLKRGGR